MTQINPTASTLNGTTDSFIQQRVCRLSVQATIHACVYQMMRYRSHVVILEDRSRMPRGMVTKTEIMHAFFNGFHPGTRAEKIMTPPLFSCHGDPVEMLLKKMDVNHTDHLFVRCEKGIVTGIVSEWDIVKKIFQTLSKNQSQPWQKRARHLQVADLLTRSVPSCLENTPVQKSMAVLIQSKRPAILITNAEKTPVGALSLTDINRAYIHCVTPSEEVGLIMGKTILTCKPSELLAHAITKIDIQMYDCLFSGDAKNRFQGILTISNIRKFLLDLVLQEK